MTNTLEHPVLPPLPASPNDGVPHRRRVRAFVMIGVGAVVAIGGGIFLIDHAVSETRHEATVFEEPVTAVDLDISSGSVRVIGSDRTDVTVDMTVRSGIRSPSHSEAVVNGRLLIHSACDFGFDNCAVDYVIRVPAGVDIAAHSSGGDINLESMKGDANVAISGGNAHLGFASAPKHVKAKADGGRIVIAVPDDGQAYLVNAKSDGGSTKVDVRTDPSSDHVIDAHVSGGNVVVEYNS
jgi:hypothetical protein